MFLLKNLREIWIRLVSENFSPRKSLANENAENFGLENFENYKLYYLKNDLAKKLEKIFGWDSSGKF